MENLEQMADIDKQLEFKSLKVCLIFFLIFTPKCMNTKKTLLVCYFHNCWVTISFVLLCVPFIRLNLWGRGYL